MNFHMSSSQNLHCAHNLYLNKSQRFLMLARLDSVLRKRKTSKKRNKFSEYFYQDDGTFFKVNMEHIKKDLDCISRRNNVLPIIINIPKQIFVKGDLPKNHFQNDHDIENLKFYATNSCPYFSSNENHYTPLNTKIKLKKRFKNSIYRKKCIK